MTAPHPPSLSAPPRTFTLTHDARPITQNAWRNLHHYQKANVTREWREAFAVLARAVRIPALEAVTVTVVHEVRDRRLPDVCACLPAFKAALDGLVDARVLHGDGPDVVRSVTFVAPVVTGRDALVVTIEEVTT